MENNNLPPQQPASPVAPAPAAVVPPASGSSNKLVIWFIVGLVLIVALVGGIYFYLGRQTASPEAPVSQKPVVQAQPTPPDTMDALERDLSSLNEGTKDADFTSVDSDLEQL